MGICRANCYKTHNELTLYPLGKCPFAPSATSYLSKKETATKSTWASEQKIKSGGDNEIGGRQRRDVDVRGMLGGAVDEQEWLGVDGSGEWRFW